MCVMNKYEMRKVLSMEGATILQAFGYYLIRLVMFGAVAAVGIAAGIKLRKVKNAKAEKAEKSEN